ncbi:MAG: hypothetical protein J0I21_02420 [Alphaproteobacteria bacterium]|nr:hypothetical protein [Alphaproteobacteria bacterium]
MKRPRASPPSSSAAAASGQPAICGVLLPTSTTATASSASATMATRSTATICSLRRNSSAGR